MYIELFTIKLHHTLLLLKLLLDLSISRCHSGREKNLREELEEENPHASSGVFAQLSEGQQGIVSPCCCRPRWEEEGESWHVSFSCIEVKKSLVSCPKCSIAYKHKTYFENGYHE